MPDPKIATMTTYEKLMEAQRTLGWLAVCALQSDFKEIEEWAKTVDIGFDGAEPIVIGVKEPAPRAPVGSRTAATRATWGRSAATP